MSADGQIPLYSVLGLLNVKVDLERAERIGEFWSYPQSRTFGELLLEIGRSGAVLVGMLREAERGRQRHVQHPLIPPSSSAHSPLTFGIA